ncbi:MAG: hypothetical protein RL097_583 [Candidatus Parcubacteria bacterium]
MEVLLGCGAGWLSSRFNFNWSIEKTRCWRIAFFYRDKEGILDHTFYDLIVPVPISTPFPSPISVLRSCDCFFLKKRYYYEYKVPQGSEKPRESGVSILYQKGL